MSDVCSATTGAGRHGRTILKALATIPILRIFDLPKALEFYRDYLGFTVDWEHRFDPESPVYMQVSRGGLVLHLSEHHGDATPGSTVYVSVEAVRRFHEELAEKALKLVELTRARTGWTIRRILKRLGFPKSRYYDWKRRRDEGLLDDMFPGAGISVHAILPEEKEAIITYALEHPREGYRRLAWMMVDEDVAYVSPSSVYRVLSDVDLLYRWKRSRRSGQPPPEPEGPNERWHSGGGAVVTGQGVRMSKKRKGSRQFTVEEKLRILEEARQPNTTVVEVLRRHQVDGTTFYRWEKQAKEGMREALRGRAARLPIGEGAPGASDSLRCRRFEGSPPGFPTNVGGVPALRDNPGASPSVPSLSDPPPPRAQAPAADS